MKKQTKVSVRDLKARKDIKGGSNRYQPDTNKNQPSNSKNQPSSGTSAPSTIGLTNNY